MNRATVFIVIIAFLGAVASCKRRTPTPPAPVMPATPGNPGTYGEVPVADAEILAAIDAGETERAIQLLSRGRNNVDASLDTGDTTALMRAAAHGNVELIERLLELGADPTCEDFMGMTAMMHAVLDRSVDGIRALAGKASWEAYSMEDGFTPLHFCVGDTNLHLDMMPVLIDLGHPMEITGVMGGTPLVWAATSGTPEQVRLLIEAGADVTAVNDIGQTGLESARVRLAFAKTAEERASIEAIIELLER